MNPIHALGIGGTILHELTHWAIARAFGADAEVRIEEPAVVYDGGVLARWQRHAVGIGPLAIGVAVAIVAAVTGFWRWLLDWSPLLWFILVVQWLHYTIRVSKADLVPERVESTDDVAT